MWISRHCLNVQQVTSEIEETRYAVRSGLRNGIRYSVVIPRCIVCPHSPFAVHAFIGGIPDVGRCFLMTKAEYRSTIVSSRLISSQYSLPGIILVNCHDPAAIPRAVGDLISPSTSQISELSFAPAVLIRDNSRNSIITRHKRDSDKSISLCDYWESSTSFSHCYRKVEGFIMLEESDGKDNNQACAIFTSFLTFVVFGNVTAVVIIIDSKCK